MREYVIFPPLLDIFFREFHYYVCVIVIDLFTQLDVEKHINKRSRKFNLPWAMLSPNQQAEAKLLVRIH